MRTQDVAAAEQALVMLVQENQGLMMEAQRCKAGIQLRPIHHILPQQPAHIVLSAQSEHMS